MTEPDWKSEPTHPPCSCEKPLALTLVEVDASSRRGQELVQRHGGGRLGGGGSAAHLSVYATSTLLVLKRKCSNNIGGIQFW